MTRSARLLSAALVLIARSLGAQENAQATSETSTGSSPSLSTPSTGARSVSTQSARELLEGYVRTALEKSPALSVIRARQSAAREMVAPAGALPDPMVGIMYQSMGAPWQPMAPMSMVQGEVSQVIPGLGKRQARREMAHADAEMRKAESETARIRIAAEVRQVFSQIYASDKEQQAIESAEPLLRVMLGAITGKFITGGADQEALAKTEVERSRLREQLLDLRANREILVARLNRLLARTDDETVPRLDGLPEISFELGPISEERLAKSSELRLQRAAIHAAVRRRENAEAETRPNFLVGLAGGATTSGEPIVTLRFGMELPIWRSTKQEPMVRAARHETEAAEGEHQALGLRIRGELAELRARLKRDTEQIALYRDEIIPKASLALSAARNSYSTGRADFSTVIEDYRIWLDAQIGLAKREADRLMTWSELQAILEGTN